MRQAIILGVLCSLLALSLPGSGFTVEIYFTEHLIDGNFPYATSSFGIDLDDDGDVDVSATSRDADEVAWWENDGSQNFTRHTISNTYERAYLIYAIDLDGDNDVDVLGGSTDSDNITWWENDGDENFTQHTIDDNFDGVVDVYAIDIDGDEHVDVLAAAAWGDEIAWWENDGHQNFTKYTIDGNFDHAYSAFAIDLDNDTDIDVLGTAAFGDQVAWWENDGAQNFTKHIIDGDFNQACDVVGIDLDQDGHVDVVAGGCDYSKGLWWYENDGSQNFTPHQIAGNRRNLLYINVVDLDADHDLDVIAAEFWEGAIRWWENDGSQNFTENTVAYLYRVMGPYAIDLDQDGDRDLFVVSQQPGALYWFENVPIDAAITLTPHNPPIQIPPRGGWCTFDGVVTNNTNAGVTVDAWTMVFLPTGHVFGPKQLYQDIYLAPYDDSLKTISQRVKRFAPPGEYTYIGYVGHYPDTKLDSSYFYFTKLESKDFASGEGFAVFDIFGDELELELPGTALLGAYPSPFNVQTNISYNLSQDGPVCLEVFNIQGRKVATLVDAEQHVGGHTITWDASGYSSGVYFYKLTTADFTETRRITLLK
jgi:hypothetical protein